MRNLELRDIAGYLPYGLKVQHSILGVLEITSISAFDLDYPIWFETRGDDKNQDYNYAILTRRHYCRGRGSDMKEIKLILHPMSDLTKPILPDGRIPLLELADVIYKDKSEWKLCQSRDGEYYARDDFNYTFYVELSDDGKLESFNLYKHPRTIKVVGSITTLFDKLHEWHFDYRGLIEAGLAIDINTVDNQ